MGKIIYLCDSREEKKLAKARVEASLTNTVLKVVPIATFAKGKFTLGIYYDNGDKHIVVYNTTTKVPIRDRTPHPLETRKAWLDWAELAVTKWESGVRTFSD
jgi:hypothetical protein